jgi:hypothetical protein
MQIARNSLMNYLPLVLSFSMALPHLEAQTVPIQLNIVVVEGEGATNNVRQRVARDPVVQVEDENHRPLVGAAVVFALPTEGATGEFGNGSKTLTILTDKQGRAAAQGLKLNGMNGKVPIHVSASYRGLTARTVINQVSVLPPGVKASSAKSGGHGALIGVLVAVGAAAAGGGAYFALHQSSSTPATTPVPPAGPTAIGITPGTGSIAGGR